MVQVINQEGDEPDASVVLPSAFVWVKNAIVLICQHLESLQHCKRLTWHQQEGGASQPPSEIWLKIGGEKGKFLNFASR